MLRASLLSGEEMTAHELFSPVVERPVRGPLLSWLCAPLCGGPHPGEGRDVHQIVRDDAQADPAVHAGDAMVATAAQTVATFEHTDATFAADAPALSTAEPR